MIQLQLQLLLIGLFLNCIGTAQVTLIPDPNFEQELVSQLIDSDNMVNGQIATADIENLLTLNVSGALINDLTGIEDFASLQMLECSLNNITAIDVSSLFNLTFLSIGRNNLTEIDISSNINLTLFNCAYNNITELDVSNNVLLEFIWAGQVEEDIVPRNVIPVIDLSANPGLETVRVSFLGLESLDVKNGNNTILTNQFEAEGNPLLECIQVDDAEAANAGLFPYDEWEVDPGVFFSEDCTLGVNDVVGVDIMVYPNPVADKLFIASKSPIKELTMFDTRGVIVIKKNTNIQVLDISNIGSGMYVLKIETQEGFTVKRLLKE